MPEKIRALLDSIQHCRRNQSLPRHTARRSFACDARTWL